MSRKVLTQSCVIQCSHGGTVVHPSSDPIRVIGGLKPNFCVDILGASISGCPKKKPCTVVSSISSAMTETNVNGTSGTYALDVAGCKTNKGAALVIASRANLNSFSLPPSGIDNVLGADASESEKQKANEKKEDEKYNLYLIRESKDFFLENIYKPLRACRAYNKIQEYYGTMDTHPQIREKIVTYTKAFVYIKLSSKKIEEYKIISKGSLFAQTTKEIKYKDENNIEHDYIPLYDGEEIEIFYTNVQVRAEQKKRAEDLSLFKSTKFDPTVPSKNKKESFFIDDISSINSNEIFNYNIDLAKEFDPKKAHQNKIKAAKEKGTSTNFTMYPLNVVTTLDDVLGKAEDMFNHYEWNYKTVFANNDSYIKNVKKKNAYIYSVANKLDYFYVSPEEQKDYDKNVNKLKHLYRELANTICNGSLGELIVKDIKNISNLADIIDPAYDTAINYFNEVEYINKSFFKNILKDENGKIEKSGKYYNGYEFRIVNNGLSCAYNGMLKINLLKNYNKRISEKFVKSYNPKFTKNYPASYKWLELGNGADEKYNNYSKYGGKVLALLVFAIYFSDKYKKEVEKSGLKNIVEDFYYTLKTSKALPNIGDDNIKDIRAIIKEQKSTYSKIFQRKDNKLLEQYESLDKINQEMSYDISLAKIAKPQKLFSDLYLDLDFESFHYNDMPNTKTFLEEFEKILVSSEIKDILTSYKNIQEFDKKDIETDYYNTMLNLIYFFTANRSLLDAESNKNSPFNTNQAHILDLIKELTKRRNEIEDIEYAKKIFELPIGEVYYSILHSHFAHSLVKSERNKEGFSQRQGNAQSFIDSFEVEDKRYEIDVSDLLDANYEKTLESKKKIEVFYEKIKFIDGISSKLRDMDEQIMSNMVDIDNDELKEIGYGFKNSSKYKAFMKSTKALSTFVAGANVAAAIFSKKALNKADIFSLSQDIHALSTVLAENMPKTVSSIQIHLQKVLSAQKITRIGSMKLLSKVGAVGVIVATVYEVQKTDENDIDGKAAIIVKNMMIAASMLIIPGIGWIGALAVILATIIIEVVWEMWIKDAFVDTNIEAYLFKSLLFNQEEHSSYKYNFTKVLNVFSSSTTDPYESKIFTQTVNEKLENKIEGFKSYIELQRYIGSNYEKNSDIFDNAMQYELINLKAVIYGYKIEVDEGVYEKEFTNGGMVEFVYEFKTKINIPKEIMQNNLSIEFKRDVDYKTIHKSDILKEGEVPKMRNDFKYETIDVNKMDKHLAKILEKKGSHLLIINRDITLKYKIEYEMDHDIDLKLFSYPGSASLEDSLELEIKSIKLVPLNDEEKLMMEKSTYGYKVQENQEVNKEKKGA